MLTGLVFHLLTAKDCMYEAEGLRSVSFGVVYQKSL